MAVSVFLGRDQLRLDLVETTTLEFELVAHDGKRFTEADLTRGFSLVYFGYTHCPDVCPLGLFAMASMLRQIDHPDDQRLSAVFVTLDPGRDTRDLLRQYVGAFHPEIIGVTGKREEIDRLAGGVGVQYVLEGEGENYLVSHTALTYLISPEGQVLRSFPDGVDVAFAVDVIEREMIIAGSVTSTGDDRS